MAATSAAASGASTQSSGQASILVVEDERIVALDLASTLKRMGYAVEGPVDTGERAVEEVRQQRPDLVLMDIRLRGAMDGVAAAECIGRETDAPVIFLTAHSDSDTLRRAQHATPYSYLVKPFRQDDLRCAIEVTLHRHTVERELRAREREVARLNAELEQRVHDRTAALEAANRELEAFSYSVAHDLRAPLRGIDGFTQLVLERSGAKLDEQDRGSLMRVRAAAQRLAKMIDDLLELARVVRSELAAERIDLSALALEVDAELRALHPGRTVEFIAQPDVVVWGDATLLRIVLHNLLANAWKFTAPRPQARVEFGAQHRDSEQHCYVRDNGVGFKLDDALHLFGVFQRLHQAREFPGNGIGLAIVQRAIQRHGGRVWADAALGAGASFWFTVQSGHER